MEIEAHQRQPLPHVAVGGVVVHALHTQHSPFARFELLKLRIEVVEEGLESGVEALWLDPGSSAVTRQSREPGMRALGGEAAHEQIRNRSRVIDPAVQATVDRHAKGVAHLRQRSALDALVEAGRPPAVDLAQVQISEHPRGQLDSWAQIVRRRTRRDWQIGKARRQRHLCGWPPSAVVLTNPSHRECTTARSCLGGA
jgi:hypothetical protein